MTTILNVAESKLISLGHLLKCLTMLHLCLLSYYTSHCKVFRSLSVLDDDVSIHLSCRTEMLWTITANIRLHKMKLMCLKITTVAEFLVEKWHVNQVPSLCEFSTCDQSWVIQCETV